MSAVLEFPLVAETPYGPVTHEVSDHGLRLTSVLTLPTGQTVTGTVGWTDLPTAQAHYADAVHAFLRRLPDLAEKASAVPDGAADRSRIARKPLLGGHVFAYLNTGPPTWLLPRGKFRLRRDGRLDIEIGIGWLRTAVSVGWKPRRSPGSTAAGSTGAAGAQ